MNSSQQAISIENLHKSFGVNEVLKGVNLFATRGEVISVLGSSGSGKSTLLRCINLLEILNSGIIRVAGEEVLMKKNRRGENRPADKRQVERIRAKLAMVFMRALPAYSNEIIFMLHGSALASVITIIDITGAARIVNSRYYSPYEAFLTAAVFYMAITFTIVFLVRRLEKRWHGHLLPADQSVSKIEATA